MFEIRILHLKFEFFQTANLNKVRFHLLNQAKSQAIYQWC